MERALYLSYLPFFGEHCIFLTFPRSEEKIKVAEEKAKNEALENLYNIFTQEEYTKAKKKLLKKAKVDIE